MIWLLKALKWMEQATEEKSSADIREKAAALMNLPLCICSFQFCKLLSEERRIIKSYYFKFLGGKRRWKEILRRLNTLRFGDVDVYKKLIPEFLQNFFQYEARLKPVTKKELELKANLWKKQNYLHYLIRIPSGGMIFYLIE